ncbi:hypothetical protein [Aquimarina sp. RZ0]|uniref:hypothetical protein n=1 Tax=Aquimarina sp. RZ0 TaxID=2607730 RepID=UPI0011F0F63C|nr:hypothetical protein [Aquimarina sp. RZ0]KAA1243054.1 hypothetical protein F0000_22850 [Aquimarina sp. RZ0]
MNNKLENKVSQKSQSSNTHPDLDNEGQVKKMIAKFEQGLNTDGDQATRPDLDNEGQVEEMIAKFEQGLNTDGDQATRPNLDNEGQVEKMIAKFEQGSNTDQNQTTPIDLDHQELDNDIDTTPEREINTDQDQATPTDQDNQKLGNDIDVTPGEKINTDQDQVIPTDQGYQELDNNINVTPGEKINTDQYQAIPTDLSYQKLDNNINVTPGEKINKDQYQATPTDLSYQELDNNINVTPGEKINTDQDQTAPTSRDNQELDNDIDITPEREIKTDQISPSSMSSDDKYLKNIDKSLDFLETLSNVEKTLNSTQQLSNEEEVESLQDFLNLLDDFAYNTSDSDLKNAFDKTRDSLNNILNTFEGQQISNEEYPNASDISNEITQNLQTETQIDTDNLASSKEEFKSIIDQIGDVLGKIIEKINDLIQNQNQVLENQELPPGQKSIFKLTKEELNDLKNQKKTESNDVLTEIGNLEEEIAEVDNLLNNIADTDIIESEKAKVASPLLKEKEKLKASLKENKKKLKKVNNELKNIEWNKIGRKVVPKPQKTIEQVKNISSNFSDRTKTQGDGVKSFLNKMTKPGIENDINQNQISAPDISNPENLQDSTTALQEIQPIPDQLENRELPPDQKSIFKLTKEELNDLKNQKITESNDVLTEIGNLEVEIAEVDNLLDNIADTDIIESEKAKVASPLLKEKEKLKASLKENKKNLKKVNNELKNIEWNKIGRKVVPKPQKTIEQVKNISSNFSDRTKTQGDGVKSFLNKMTKPGIEFSKGAAKKAKKKQLVRNMFNRLKTSNTGPKR